MQRINPAGLPEPRGYTHATAATGRFVFLAGQTAQDAGGVVAGTVAEQFGRALANLLTALAAAGGSTADLASLTIYVTDLDAYRQQSTVLGEIWRRLAGADYPAMAVVEVSRLWDPSALVEIQGIAVVPDAGDGPPEGAQPGGVE
jgi:enamine deaminase RidA (YjgF/YER057c/UK114 family)